MKKRSKSPKPKTDFLNRRPRKARSSNPLFDVSDQIASVNETLDTYDFKSRTDIVKIADIRLSIRDMFIDAGNGMPFPFEELAVLAVIGLAKDL